MNKKQQIEECEKILKQLERIEKLKSALVSRIIKVNKYTDLVQYTDAITYATVKLEYEVEKYQFDLKIN